MPNTLFGYVHRNVSVPILKKRELDAESIMPKVTKLQSRGAEFHFRSDSKGHDYTLPPRPI